MKIKRIKILFRLLRYFFVRGTARQKPQNIRKIAIFQPAGLGDMVCATPMFRAIKKQYPDAYIYVIGQQALRELLEGNRDVDEYIGCDNNAEEVIAYLKTKSIDFGCIPTPSFLGLSVLYLGDVKMIVSPRAVGGFNPQQTFLYRVLRLCTVQKKIRFSAYMPGEYLKLLEPIEICTEDTQKHLQFSQAGRDFVRDFFRENNIEPDRDLVVGISPSSGNKIKNWGGKKFALLADHIFARYHAKIVITGGQNDVREVDSMLSHIGPETKIINALNAFNLDELKAFIASVHVFIGVDTGPIYIAEAFNTPTIDIIGPVAENEQAPVGRHHVVVKWEQRKSAVVHILNARMYDRVEARRQVDMITSEQVGQALDDLFKVLKKDGKLPEAVSVYEQYN